jgi:hypothetical protein
MKALIRKIEAALAAAAFAEEGDADTARTIVAEAEEVHAVGARRERDGRRLAPAPRRLAKGSRA